MKLLSLIVPVLNEEEAVPLFYEAVQEVLRDEPYELEILFVDDGSTDKTLEIIEELHARDPRVRGISFSRNFGKELALAAGLQAARGDAVVPMDVDLQDPPALLKQFLRLWEQGYETVIGVRSRRDADSWAKRVSAGLVLPAVQPVDQGTGRPQCRGLSAHGSRRGGCSECLA